MEPQTINTIQLKPAVRGFLLKVEAFKGINILGEDGEWAGNVLETPGSRRTIGHETENQILDAGRNIMADFSGWAGPGSKCQVGTDSTTPTALDTSLGGYVAGTSTIYTSSFAAQGSEPYYMWYRVTYRFAVGVAEGNLSEAGIGWNTADGPYLISRALIVNGAGVPTTATVRSDELLDVTYELRYYPPLNDVLGTVTLDGVVYDTITRAANVTSGGSSIGRIMGVWTGGTVFWKAYDGDVGEIWEGPDGLHEDCNHSGQFNEGYQNNSYQIDMQITCGASGWNLTGPPIGIRSIWIATNAGNFQTQFNAQGDDSRIPKTTEFTLNFVWRLGWTVKDDIP